jgi:hypothetical protein
MSNGSGAPAGRTGAPTTQGGNELTCQNCHGGSINQGTNPVTLSIAGNPATFEPSTVYDMTVTFANPSGSGHGFQIVALNPQLASTGTFQAGQGNKIITGVGNRQYVTHNSSGNNTWSFKWTSPATLPASVSFYVVSAARGADRAFTLSRTIENTPTSVSGVNEKEAIALYPFNVDKDLFISAGNVANPILSWKMVDNTGRVILESEETKINEIERVSLPSGVHSGLYQVLIQTPTGRVTKRFFKN